MARTRQRKALPPLPDWELPVGSGRDQARLERSLEDYCRRAQQEERIDFYSIREVAEHFGVSRTMAHQAFVHLADCGLLRLIRGSKTQLEGRTREHPVTARGRVGVIVPLQTFQQHEAFSRAGQELTKAFRAGGYMTDLYFGAAGGVLDEANITEIRHNRVDWLIWLEPTRAAVPTMLRLRDAGVEVLSVGYNPSLQPARHLQIPIEEQVRSCFEGWKSQGIARLVIASDVDRSDSQAVRFFQRLGRAAGLVCETWEIAQGLPDKNLTRIAREKRVGVVFTSGQLEGLCCATQSLQLEKLAGEGRLLFPYGLPKRFARDLMTRARNIAVDWPHIAAEMVRTVG